MEKGKILFRGKVRFGVSSIDNLMITGSKSECEQQWNDLLASQRQEGLLIVDRKPLDICS